MSYFAESKGDWTFSGDAADAVSITSNHADKIMNILINGGREARFEAID
ncbi:hypothetical protein ACJKIH_23660 [Brucella pseudogrignonensis]